MEQEQSIRRKGAYPREDRALKAAAQFMGEELLPLLGVKGKIKRIVPTEQVVLRTEDFFEDFNYEMEDGRILHLEFESDSITKDDLRRFRLYDAAIGYQYKREVETCVICTARSRKIRKKLIEGKNRYEIRVVRLKSWNADEMITELEKKQKTKQLERQELLQVILSPLMGGEMPQPERISRSFQLLRGEEGSQERQDLLKMQAVLYLLAEKFLEKEDLERLKEEIHMTRLGQMLFDDGVERGLAQGMEQGLERGIAQGIAQGVERGIAQTKQIFRLAGENISVQEIARRLSISEEEVRKVLE